MADTGTTLVIPWQWQREWNGWTVTTDAGRVFHFKRADEWFFGTSLGREVSETVTLGIEWYAEAANRWNRSALLMNVGGSVKLSERQAILVAVGRDLHRHEGDRASFVGYLGWQVNLK